MLLKKQWYAQQKVADKLHNESPVIMCDLAVATHAHVNQALQTSTFDALYMLLGNFHLKLTFL